LVCGPVLVAPVSKEVSAIAFPSGPEMTKHLKMAVVDPRYSFAWKQSLTKVVLDSLPGHGKRIEYLHNIKAGFTD
jgi:hypothetical protein